MIALLVIALFTLGTAAVAMSLRDIIHCALLLVASWAGIAAFYLWAGAEFVAFAQVLVYVGAVSMIVLFAVLLTRRSRAELAIGPDSMWRLIGALPVGGAVLGVLFGAVLGTNLPEHPAEGRFIPVRQLGTQLMTAHAAALLIVGVILTVALLGGVVLAATEREDGKETKS
jgi:NADH:ubiquinone oxidoreductase subunit 6 (subunit J)